MVRPSVAGYTILAELGRGGFAVVYRARQDTVGREVALKILSRVDLDARALQRFQREARAMGALSWHPHIVVLHDAGQASDGVPYLAMEYLEQGSLGDRLRAAGPLSWDAVAVIGIEVAGALETAHREGLLHRDLKPENLLIGPWGHTKLADFGIVTPATGTRTTGAGAGSVTGTIAHTAPEVLDGARATVASDVYSLGSTLYELLAGAPAFLRPGDESAIVMALRAVTEPVPDLRARGIPDPLAAVVERAMAKSPAERYPTALALGQALQHVQSTADHPVTLLRLRDDPPPTPRDGVADAAPGALTTPHPSPVPTTSDAAGTAAPPAGSPDARTAPLPSPSPTTTAAAAASAQPMTGRPRDGAAGEDGPASPVGAEVSTTGRRGRAMPAHEGVVPPVPVPGYERPAPSRFGGGSKVWGAMVGLGMAAVVGVAAITVARGGGFGAADSSDAGAVSTEVDAGAAAEPPGAVGEEAQPTQAEEEAEPTPADDPGEPLATGAPDPPAPNPPPPVGALPPIPADVGERIPVPQPQALAAGGGVLWAALGSADAVALVGGDASVALPSRPGALAFAGGRLFVALPDSDEIVAIDPDSRSIIGTVAIGEDPRALAGSAEELWVGTDAGLVRLDPLALEVRQRIPTPLPVRAVATGGGPTFAVLDGGTALVVVEAAGSVASPIELAEPLLDVSLDGDGSIVVLGVRRVLRLDAASHDVLAERAVADGIAVAAAPDVVWVARVPDELLELDRELTGLLVVLPLDGPPADLVATTASAAAVAVPAADLVVTVE